MDVDDFGNAETLPAPEPTKGDIMAMLEAISARMERAERQRADEMREWSAWRSTTAAAVSNLAERLSELRSMYGQVVEVLPIAKRTEEHVDEIMNWMNQGGHAAKRRGA